MMNHICLINKISKYCENNSIFDFFYFFFFNYVLRSLLLLCQELNLEKKKKPVKIWSYQIVKCLKISSTKKKSIICTKRKKEFVCLWWLGKYQSRSFLYYKKLSLNNCVKIMNAKNKPILPWPTWSGKDNIKWQI